mgnify:CR=1 FL=1
MKIKTLGSADSRRLKIAAAVAVTAFLTQDSLTKNLTKYKEISAWKFSTSPIYRRTHRLARSVFIKSSYDQNHSSMLNN